MPYIDGGGSTTFQALTYLAYGSKFTPSSYSAVPISPAQGASWPSLQPTLVALCSGDPSPYSVQFDVAAVSDFSAITWTTTLANQTDGFISAAVPAATLNDITQYWWRVKAGTGSWSATQAVYINANVGPGQSYMEHNIGVWFDPAYNPGGSEQMTLNVGVWFDPAYNEPGAEQMTLNIGVWFDPSGATSEQMYLNVDATTPTPFVWILVPDSARPGDGVRVYGHGFGDTQVYYNGIVEAWVDPNWVPVQVVTWQTFPPTANAYTSARVIDPIAGIVDWQHNEIGILVEEWMEPLGYLLRVRTDGA